MRNGHVDGVIEDTENIYIERVCEGDLEINSGCSSNQTVTENTNDDTLPVYKKIKARYSSHNSVADNINDDSLPQYRQINARCGSNHTATENMNDDPISLYNKKVNARCSSNKTITENTNDDPLPMYRNINPGCSSNQTVTENTNDDPLPVYKNISNSRFNDEQLISLVQQRPALYNFRLPLKQRTKDIKDKLWKEIVRIMNVELSVSDIAKKWKALRDYYMKIKPQIKNKPPSGTGSDEVDSRKVWKFFHLMRFLDDTLEMRQTHTNINAACDTEKPETSTQKTTKKKRASEAELLQTIGEIVKAPIRIENSGNSSCATPTGCDFFCMRLAEGLKKLPYLVRSRLEIEFLDRLHEVIQERGLE